MLVDIDDIQKLIELNKSWYTAWEKYIQNYYVFASNYVIDKNGKKKNKILCLHRIIMQANKDEIVDHINHNTLDNRKENLRIVTKQENTSNRKGANSNSKTGIRNVNWIPSANEYWVQIMKNGENYKWAFPASQFGEACKFAEEKRKELFGDYRGN